MNQIFWYMLRISPIAGVHFKVCFGVAKVSKSLMEHYMIGQRNTPTPRVTRMNKAQFKEERGKGKQLGRLTL